MEARRATSTTLRTSPDTTAPSRPCAFSHTGMTTWFDTIVASASVATITIDVADENPPRKLRPARPSRPSARGIVSTKRSGFEPAGIRSRPTTAMGTTNRLMSIR